jgi:hypothetical protein
MIWQIVHYWVSNGGLVPVLCLFITMLLTPVESAHSYNQIGNWVGPKVERGSHLNLILIRHSLGFSKTSQFYDKNNM